MRPRDLFMGLRGSIGGCQGVLGGQEGIQGIPWGHRVGLMSFFMIQGIHACIYVIQIFLAHGTDEPTEGCTRGPHGPKKPLENGNFRT